MYKCPRLCVQVQKGPRPTSLASDSQACAMILSIDSSTSGASDQADARKVNNRQPREYKYDPDALVLLIERLRGKDHIKKMKQYHIKRMQRPWLKHFLARGRIIIHTYTPTNAHLLLLLLLLLLVLSIFILEFAQGNA